MATPAPPQTRQCVACGRTMMWDANVCPYCGKDYRQPAPGMMMQMAPPVKQKSAIPIVGGILMLLVGIIGLIEGLVIIMVAAGVMGMFGLLPIDIVGMAGGLLSTILMIAGLIPVVLGIFAMLGGVSAATRKHFGLAIVGGIFAMLIIGPYFITNVLGLVALILVVVSHHEFD